MDSDQWLDEDEARLHAILGNDVERNKKNAERYRQYLLARLPLPLLVTGNEDFPWEEPYLFGVRDKRDYEKLKLKKPAHTDTFELQALERPDRHGDVMARIKRVSDGKVFLLGLSWLCCKDETCEAFTLLDDYGVWHANY
ncbi:MAG: hypothetical protein RBU24_02210 [Kiritimatiellia bacterium]|nr:hypothetical protein [Kiritimatiellia bacterium]